MVFDAKGKTFRDDWYPDYKANRPPMPEDLRAQIEPVHAAVRAEGFPILMIDGVEADDVIGTLAGRAWREGIRTVISTGDKDMAQLVNPHVSLVNTMSNETLDEAGVVAKFGVAPQRIVDYLSLIGDTVDNVPEIAQGRAENGGQMAGRYGSLDNIIANADKIGGVVGQNLRNTLDWLPMAKRLVTIKCDLPLPQGPADLVPLPQDVGNAGSCSSVSVSRPGCEDSGDCPADQCQCGLQSGCKPVPERRAGRLRFRAASGRDYRTIFTDTGTR